MMFAIRTIEIISTRLLLLIGAIWSVWNGLSAFLSKNADDPADPVANETLRLAPDSSDDEREDDVAAMKTDAMTSSGYSTTSGYRSEHDIDWDYEMFKISVAPRGPVHDDDRILMTVTCPTSRLYVKAVLDNDDAAVRIVTFAPFSDATWQWVESQCEECRLRIEESLHIAGYRIPFVASIEEEEEEDVSSPDVSRDDDSDDEDVEADDEDEDRIEHAIGPLFALQDFVIRPLPRGTEDDLLSESNVGFESPMQRDLDQELGSDDDDDELEYDLAELLGDDGCSYFAFA